MQLENYEVTHSHGSSRSTHLLDVRQPPCFVEEWLRWDISTEHTFEPCAGLRRYSVRLLACRRRWTDVDIHRAVSVLLPLGNLRGAAGPRQVADQGVGRAVIDCRRPILLDRRIGRNGQAIG